MYDYTEAFFERVFFPALKERGITTVIHAGDVVDRRKYINFVTARKLQDILMRPLLEGGYETYVAVGNHDVYYRDTNEINAMTELYGSDIPNLHIFTTASEVTIDGTKILLVPWICSANMADTISMINNTTAQICIGHLELNGFEMDRGHIQEHGMDKSMFDRFDLVLSGHYHHKSSIGNIHYMGSQLQFTWADYDDDKGFHILDTDTREIEFIRNPFEMFKKFIYDDQSKTHAEVLNFDESKYAKTYVKVVVKSKVDPYLYDKVIQKIESAGVANLQVVEDHLNLDILDDDDILDEAQDTQTLLKKYVSQLEVPNLSVKKIEKYMLDLYTEALSLERS